MLHFIAIANHVIKWFNNRMVYVDLRILLSVKLGEKGSNKLIANSDFKNMFAVIVILLSYTSSRYYFNINNCLPSFLIQPVHNETNNSPFTPRSEVKRKYVTYTKILARYYSKTQSKKFIFNLLKSKIYLYLEMRKDGIQMNILLFCSIYRT